MQMNELNIVGPLLGPPHHKLPTKISIQTQPVLCFQQKHNANATLQKGRATECNGM
jgi:hypothetical protein